MIRKKCSSKPGMRIIRSVHSMSGFACAFKRSGKKIGFVPTMGALHEGHISLIKKAGRENDSVIVSVFVNPLQFGPAEDLRKYPRTFAKDAAICRKAGVSALFHPSVEEMYREGFSTFVDVPLLSDKLCGAFRPGHFKGVATVVLKLLNIVNPDSAYFGMKDAQQFFVISRMVRDLDMRVRVRALPTVREKDGLALSSRNSYLNSREREQAVCLYRALREAGKMINSGERRSAVIEKRIRSVIALYPAVALDYARVVDTQRLEPLPLLRGRCLLAAAVRVGNTRLIDNIVVKIK